MRDVFTYLANTDLSKNNPKLGIGAQNIKFQMQLCNTGISGLHWYFLGSNVLILV